MGDGPVPNNWGRWGPEDQLGALNLITPEKRLRALSSVRRGLLLSLSRPLQPHAQQVRILHTGPTSGAAVDHLSVDYHGPEVTHLDALCHVWDDDGMWNGHPADDAFGPNGATWGGLDNWRSGIVTRGILLDVPRFRQEPYVGHDQPVRGEELEAIARHREIVPEPGDALVVYAGRDRWDEANPPWGVELTETGQPRRPGLHVSCLNYLRDNDFAVLAWDMMDAVPATSDSPWPVHRALSALGVALVDNCDLAQLAATCAQESRSDFLFTVSPLVVRGGTGSPVNPLALL